MATEPDRWNGLAIPGGHPGGRGKAKPKSHQDMYLCVAFVVLLAWALFVGVGAVNWSAIWALL
jgi:hypothetical protein